MGKKLQILVKGEPLDLAEGEAGRFSMSKQIYNLSDLETRNGDQSRRLIIPTSPNNRKLLQGQLPTDSRFSDAAVSSIDCQVLVDGVPLIEDAYLLPGAQTRTTISITIYGGTSKFFASLREAPISELNFTEFNLEWTLAGITPILASTTGIVYATSLWYTNVSRRVYEATNGQDSETNLEWQELGESGFFIYLKTVLDKIWTNIGLLTVDDSKLDTLFNESAIAVPVPVVHDSFGAIEGSYSEVRTDTEQDIIGTPQLLVFEDVISNPSNFWDIPTNRFVFDIAGFFIVKVQFDGRYRLGPTTLRIMGNISGQEVVIKTITLAPIGSGFQNFSVGATTSINVTATDYIWCDGESLQGIPVLETASFIVELEGLGRGRSVDVGAMLPNITQRQFVKEVFKLFNIVPVERNNVITLEYFESIRTNEKKQLSLNGLRRNDVKATDILLTYGQENIVKYKDNENVERLDANDSFQVNSQTLNKEVIKIQSAFCATDIAAKQAGAGTGHVVIPNYHLAWKKVTDNKMQGVINTTTYTTTQRNNIVAGDFIVAGTQATRRRVTAVLTEFEGQIDEQWTATFNEQDWDHWTYEKLPTEIHVARIAPSAIGGTRVYDGFNFISEAIFPAQFPFNQLAWQSLLSSYYDLLTQSVFRPFVVSAWAVMPITQFIATNSLNAIYLEEFESYFYVNKMDQWKINQAVKLELIELKV